MKTRIAIKRVGVSWIRRNSKLGVFDTLVQWRKCYRGLFVNGHIWRVSYNDFRDKEEYHRKVSRQYMQACRATVVRYSGVKSES